MRAWAVVPVKHDSARFPGKNFAHCGGESLARRAVRIGCDARALGIVERVVILASQGWESSIYDEVGSGLANVWCVGWPDSNSRQVLRGWLESEPESERPELICQLLPTSPLRTLRHVIESRLLLESGVDVVMSVTPFRQDVRYALALPSPGDPFLGRCDSAGWAEREYGVHDGTILWGRQRYVLSDSFARYGWYGGRVVPYRIPPEDSADVNTELDLVLAECLLARREGRLPGGQLKGEAR